MEKVSLDDVDRRMGPASVKKPLADALGTDGIALNYYELEPGESFAFGYHRHPRQEECFYVVEGTAIFETEDGDVAVGPNEAIRFAPGEWQQGRNDGDERVVALAIGAPKTERETEMLRSCPDCGGRTENEIEMADDRSALVTRCSNCGAETGRFD